MIEIADTKGMAFVDENTQIGSDGQRHPIGEESPPEEYVTPRTVRVVGVQEEGAVPTIQNGQAVWKVEDDGGGGVSVVTGLAFLTCNHKGDWDRQVPQNTYVVVPLNPYHLEANNEDDVIGFADNSLGLKFNEPGCARFEWRIDAPSASAPYILTFQVRKNANQTSPTTYTVPTTGTTLTGFTIWDSIVANDVFEFRLHQNDAATKQINVQIAATHIPGSIVNG